MNDKAEQIVFGLVLTLIGSLLLNVPCLVPFSCVLMGFGIILFLVGAFAEDKQ